MTISLRGVWVGGRSAALAVAASIALCTLPVQAAQTSAGTAISNQASLTYTDIRANVFNLNSETVTTTIGAAPALTVAGLAAGSSVPGGQYTAAFTITNTGNGNGSIALIFGAAGGTDGPTAVHAAYQLSFSGGMLPGTSPADCTNTSPLEFTCASAAAAAALVAAVNAPAGGTVGIAVVTNVAAGAAGGMPGMNSIVTPLSGTIAYTAAANPGIASSVTSGVAAGTSVEPIQSDARLDLAEAESAPGGPGNPSPEIVYTLYAANGGSAPARDLTSVQVLLGSPAAGIFFSDKIPVFAANAPLQVTAITAGATGALVAAGATTTIYSTASALAGGPWTRYTGGILPSGTTFVGVLLSGGTGGVEIAGNNNLTSAGGTPNAPSAATAQVTLQFFVTPPTGSGSGDLAAVVNQADSVSGGNQANPAPISGVANRSLNVLGPNITAGTADGAVAIDSGSHGLLYPTQAAGTASLQAGASNSVGGGAAVVASVLTGPLGAPGAAGSYTGTAAADTNNDYTAISYTPAGFRAVNTGSSGVLGNAMAAASTVTFANSLQNVGNRADNLSLTVTAPAGWGVQIFAASSSGTPAGPVLAGSAAGNVAAYTFNGVPSGLSGDSANIVNYAVVYTVPAGARAFTPYDATAVVVSANAPAHTNATHNETIIGGPVALYKTQAIDNTTCPGGAVIAGCIVMYAIHYLNIAQAPAACPSSVAGPAGAPGAVAFASGGFYGQGLIVSEDGTLAPNTWGASLTGSGARLTGGLTAPAVDATLAATTFPTGNTTGSYSFTALIGGTSTYLLAPGCSGSIQFSVTVGHG